MKWCYKSFGQPVSRVLYLAIIYLDVLSPARSSDLPLGRRRAAALTALSWSCSGWGLHGNYVTITPGELLPHHFTLTTALSVSAVCFCCTFPIVTYARRYLASSPYGARTFLIHPEGARNCLDYPKLCLLYHFQGARVYYRFCRRRTHVFSRAFNRLRAIWFTVIKTGCLQHFKRINVHR